MASKFNKYIEQMSERELQRLATLVTETKDRLSQLSTYVEQTDIILSAVDLCVRPQQSVTNLPELRSYGTQTITETSDVGSQTEMESQTQDIEMESQTCSDLEEAGQADTPVRATFIALLKEMKLLHMKYVVHSAWLSDLLTVIGEIYPEPQFLANYYIPKNTGDGAFPTKLYEDAGLKFVSAMDNMCTYELRGNNEIGFPDIELLLHYAMAYASKTLKKTHSYEEFCKTPLTYDSLKLAKAVQKTIHAITENPKELDDICPDRFATYHTVLESVQQLVEDKSPVLKNCILTHFITFTNAYITTASSAMDRKEMSLLLPVIRTALILNYCQPATESNAVSVYKKIIDASRECDTKTMEAKHVEHNMNSGLFMSTGQILPGLYGFLFHISRATGKPGTQEASSVLTHIVANKISHHRNLHKKYPGLAQVEKETQAWLECSHGARRLMSKNVVYCARLDMDKDPPAVGPKNRNNVDLAIIKLLIDLSLKYQSNYEHNKELVLGYMTEENARNNYFGASVKTRKEHKTKLGIVDTLKLWMNPFLYKKTTTATVDAFGRQAINLGNNPRIASSTQSVRY